MTRVLSLLPVIGHPRDSKRIDMLLAERLTVEAAAFVRPYPMNRAPNCPVTELAEIENGRYLRRILATVGCFPRIARLVRRNDVIYASGQDMALMGLVAQTFSRKPVIMEIGDLRAIQFATGPKGVIMRALDRFIASKVAFIVTTSERYITEFYAPLLGRTPEYVTVENKLDASFAREIERRGRARPKRATSPSEPLTLGYFGVLRFQWCIDALYEVLRRSAGRVRLLLAGYPTKDVDLSRLLSLSDVEYVPHYRSPDDLPSLYDRVDMVWGCYPVSSGQPSAKVGRTNRFYEASLFRKPLIVLAGTGDAAAVEKLDLGPTIPSEDFESAVATVTAVTPADRSRWEAALDALPSDIYSYSDEQSELARRIRVAATGANDT